MDLGDPDMLDYACNHTILFNGVINSQRNKYIRAPKVEKTGQASGGDHGGEA